MPTYLQKTCWKDFTFGADAQRRENPTWAFLHSPQSHSSRWPWHVLLHVFFVCFVKFVSTWLIFRTEFHWMITSLYWKLLYINFLPLEHSNVFFPLYEGFWAKFCKTSQVWTTWTEKANSQMRYDLLKKTRIIKWFFWKTNHHSLQTILCVNRNFHYIRSSDMTAADLGHCYRSETEHQWCVITQTCN